MNLMRGTLIGANHALLSLDELTINACLVVSEISICRYVSLTKNIGKHGSKLGEC